MSIHLAIRIPSRVIKMEKKIYLSFPNHNYVGLEMLSTISIELQGFCYKTITPDSENSGILHYHPKSGSLLYYNSFMPVISVEETPGSPGVCLSIVGKLPKKVQSGLMVFYVLICLLQCYLIILSVNGSLGNPFVAFIPIIIFAFLFILSQQTMSLATKAFAKKYKIKIKELLSSDNMIYSTDQEVYKPF